MLQIFNCGIGYVVIVGQEEADDVLGRLAALDQPAWAIGTVERRREESEEQVYVDFG
jgi:phosphoribosylformylglycinamidine cyclo-ligase